MSAPPLVPAELKALQTIGTGWTIIDRLDDLAVELLATRGYVERKMNPTGRRQSGVVLTERGLKALAQVGRVEIETVEVNGVEWRAVDADALRVYLTAKASEYRRVVNYEAQEGIESVIADLFSEEVQEGMPEL